jgi:DNA-directed RNA polymerase delta subunit
MLDGRFVFLGDNLWDLRSRQTFDKVHIDMKDAYSDDYVSSENNEENDEVNYSGDNNEDLEDNEDENSENDY